MDLSRRIFLSAAPMMAAGATATGPALAAGVSPIILATDLGLKPNAKGDQSTAMRKAIAKASERGGALFLPAGTYRLSDVRIDRPIAIHGIRGGTKLVTATGSGIFTIEAASVTLDGIGFEGEATPAESENDLVSASSSPSLTIRDCTFDNFAGTGLMLKQCSGRLIHNSVSNVGRTGIFALDSIGLDISGNDLQDIGNNGIQVWTSEQRPDGTIVSGNRIERVRFDKGGTGQNGNGIVVFRAGNVIVSHNRVSDCGYSAVRNNSGRNCQIVNNSVSRLAETAIYVEFAFDGAVISGNVVETAASGISITNFNEGGRLAVCANNVLRHITGGGSNPETRGVAIGAEADTIVTGNVIEEAAYCGLHLGWGRYARNLLASGNLMRMCGTAIVASVSQGAGPMSITGNMIAQSGKAIVGMDHSTVITDDLAVAHAAIPAHLTISGNMVS
ncbi:MAG: TIGR03808 family TAT-translocated repetitive protein [Parvibaculaceae bacterium]